ILRYIGLIDTHLAWVYSGTHSLHYKLPLDLPHSNANHAIVRVRAEGKTFWIDPTLRSGYAQSIPTSIQGRYAIVFDPSSPGKEWIPQTDHTAAVNYSMVS